ncbi:MAG: glycine cleavage system aminomethyltransferase GcvT [Verrucomicrobiota bacterium JB022]|nr:glycine cleavage system aminomethyltransferase GcvT [Verrucomicrobiota bacterium JB022]
MADLRTLPLREFHVAHGARLVPFAGWEMPVQYTGIKAEHKAVREAAGLFDVSHMGEVIVRGSQAREYLDHLVTNRMPTEPGRAVYAIMCQPDGGAIDDLIVYCRSEQDYFVVVNASNRERDVKWMQEQAEGYEVEVTDVSDDYVLLALQGPKAQEILQAVTPAQLSQFKRFRFEVSQIVHETAIIARTGYTGEDGFEIFVSPAAANKVVDAIMTAGQPHGLLLAGLGCRDSLRLEAGYPLYGFELMESINPIEAGLGWTVKWNKPGKFVGQDALELHHPAPTRRVVYFRLDGPRIARHDTPILAGETQVGRVLSGTMSPILNQPIGSALIEDYPATVGQGVKLEVDLRGNREPLEVVNPPLHVKA